VNFNSVTNNFIFHTAYYQNFPFLYNMPCFRWGLVLCPVFQEGLTPPSGPLALHEGECSDALCYHWWI